MSICLCRVSACVSAKLQRSMTAAASAATGETVSRNGGSTGSATQLPSGGRPATNHVSRHPCVASGGCQPNVHPKPIRSRTSNRNSARFKGERVAREVATTGLTRGAVPVFRHIHTGPRICAALVGKGRTERALPAARRPAAQFPARRTASGPVERAVGPCRGAGMRGVTASSEARPWAVYPPRRCPAHGRGVNRSNSRGVLWGPD